MEASSNPFFLFPLFIKPQEASLLKNKEVSFLLLQDCQSWARNIFLRQRQRDHIIEFLLQGKNPKNVTVSVSLIIWSEPIKVCTYLSWYIKLSIAPICDNAIRLARMCRSRSHHTRPGGGPPLHLTPSLQVSLLLLLLSLCMHAL